MKKTIIILCIIISLYSISILIRATLTINKVESYVEQSLMDIAQPWNSSKFTSRASFWLKEYSNLKPNEITQIIERELGNLIYIEDQPNCDIYKGIAQHEKLERIYSDCSLAARFDKKTAIINIRLVREDEEWKINNFISIK